MKFIHLLIPVCLLGFFSCKDEVTSNNPNNPIVITSLRGTITNLPANTRTVKGLVMDTSSSFNIIATNTIGADEVMNLDLTTPPGSSLIDINDYLSTISGSVLISNEDARVSALETFAYYDTAQSVIAGSVWKDNHTPNSSHFPGYIYVSALYCDRNLQLSGTRTRIINSDTTVTNYNANLGNGWNMMTFKVIEVRQNHNSFEMVSGELSGASWYFFPH